MTLKTFVRNVITAPRRALGVERPMVLMYHRVWTPTVDPWRLSVSPQRFASQIAALVADRSVVPLSWLMQELTAGRFPLRTAAVTFDDGYHDLLSNARPILKKAGCPATVFIPTAAIETGRGFWWDILSRLVLETQRLPDRLVIDLGERRHELPVFCAANSDGPGTKRRLLLHAKLHALLLPARSEERDNALEQLADQIGVDATSRDSDRSMTADEVREMARDDLIEIGAHTVNHPALNSLTAREQCVEVAESRARCEAILGRQVTGFAYPYGRHDANSLEAVKAAGLAYACSTRGGPVRRSSHPLVVPRVLVADWSETEFRREALARA